LRPLSRRCAGIVARGQTRRSSRRPGVVMQPKLRAVTSVAATPRGILFRLGDRFLEIKGDGCWPCFRRVEGLLNGRVTLEGARELLKPNEYALLTRTVDALRRAEML